MPTPAAPPPTTLPLSSTRSGSSPAASTSTARTSSSRWPRSRRRSPTRLNASSDVPVKVVWKPVLTDSDAIRRTALEANSDDAVIGVTAWMHTFSPAKMWIQGLDLLRKPLLHLHTQANVELPWEDIDFDFMNLNQAAHGDREFGYIQSRLGIPRKTVVGHVSNPEVSRQVGVWQRASAGWAAVRTPRS